LNENDQAYLQWVNTYIGDFGFGFYSPLSPNTA